jgi:hypothetical protein
MGEAPSGYRTPYTATPGSSTPGPHVDKEEGLSELYGFILLSLISTALIVVVGLAAWAYAH